MANICWFEMRIRGNKENCYAMVNSDIPCYDAYVKAEKGTDADYMVYVRGECRWSVTESMVDVDEGSTLAAKAKKFSIELEVCGLDESGEISERFHYKGSEVITEKNLPSHLQAWVIEEGETELSEENLAKYEKNGDVYLLKDEYSEKFEYDYDKDEAVFDFTMSFKDLPGFEDYEEDEDGEDDENPFGDKSAILAMMGIEPDENGFAISYSEEDDDATLYEYFGTEKKVAVPYGVTELEMGCFSLNEEVEEIMLPETLKYIGEDCFENCPNLKKVIIPASVEGFVEDDNTFDGSPNVTIFTLSGSEAEKFSKEKGIKVVNI